MTDTLAQSSLRPVTLVGGPAGRTVVMIGAGIARYEIVGICRCGRSQLRLWTYYVDPATRTARYWPSEPHSAECETGMYPPRQISPEP